MLLPGKHFQEQTLEEFIQVAPKYPLERFKLECPNHKKQTVMATISEKLPDIFRDIESISTVDGLRLDSSYGWVLIRPSGTEPLLRITIEGRTRVDVEKIKAMTKQILKQVI